MNIKKKKRKILQRLECCTIVALLLLTFKLAMVEGDMSSCPLE